MELSEAVGQHERHQQCRESQGDDVLRLAQVERPTRATRRYATTRLSDPHKTLTVDDDSPSPGGLANGLWNGLPEMPLTRCGIALARNAPPKK